MKKHVRRHCRSSLAQFLAGESLWAMHEPALVRLRGCLAMGAELDRSAIAAALGLAESLDSGAASQPPRVQMAGGVAVLKIEGVISQRETWLTRSLGWTASETLARDVSDLAAAAGVTAIVLLVDSPGGTAQGNEEASQTIFSARARKPIYAYARGIMASAAYYLGSAASAVFAGPSALVGSIGAVSTHVEYAAALSQAGIGVRVVRSGKNKQLWNPYEKLEGPALAALEKLVADFGLQFEAAVARHRGLGLSQVQARFGQGGVFLAGEAAAHGLIDGVMSFSELMARIQGDGANRPQFAAGDIPSVVGQQAAARTIGSDFLELAASGISAAASAAHSTLPTDISAEQNSMTISQRVRAALFARGFILSQDAEEAICEAALAAFFAARGEDRPTADEALIAALLSAAASASQAAPLDARNARSADAALNVNAAHEREMLEARTEAARDENRRQKEIRASGELLGMSAEQVAAAIDSLQGHDQVVVAWHAALAQREQPVAAQSPVRTTGEGIDRYLQDAAAATLLHFGQSGGSVPEHIQQLSHAPLVVHAERCLQAHGIRYTAYDREDIAAKALAMDGYERSPVRADGGMAYNRPGMFPNLLSALANKLFDEGVEAAETTYQGYAGVLDELPDFKPAPIIARSGFNSLDEVLDAEEFKEQGLAEECLSYMVLGRFGNAAQLTPVMVANDDLGAFLDLITDLAEGWELTKNRLCLNLITGNVALLDSYALYDDTYHGNDIASGAGPSVTSWDAMQQKLAAQTTVGGVAYSRARLGVALVPPKYEVAAQQTFLPLGGTVVVESKQATADSSLNVFRGKVRVLMEPELAASSTTKWYGFADPVRRRNAAIAIAYFRGWGKAGKRERWYDAKTKCWNVSLEGRFGAAAKQYRTTVRNAG